LKEKFMRKPRKGREKDINDREFKEFCWFESRSCRIKAEERGEKFADGKPKGPEGGLGF
jgi:hypothetical protein